MFRSTCFGRLSAHHQELTTALTASGFTLERGDSSVVSRGLASYNLPDHDQQCSSRFCPTVKPTGQTRTNNAAITTLEGKTRGC